MPVKVDLNRLSVAQVEKLILLLFCPQIGPSKNRNGPSLVSTNTAFFGRKMPKTISPDWAQTLLPVLLNFLNI